MNDYNTRLHETGQIYVTQAAAETMARAAGAHVEESRRLLTRLLMHATAGQDDAGMKESPERWRYRRQADGIDITARVARQDDMAVVVAVNVRELRKSRS